MKMLKTVLSSSRDGVYKRKKAAQELVLGLSDTVFHPPQFSSDSTFTAWFVSPFTVLDN